MRKSNIIFASLFIASPAIAAGDPVLITAGEHEGYSRIAFDAKDAKISVDQKGRTVRLLNIDQATSFDLKNINIGHKAHRIINGKTIQTPKGNAIEFTLNCDCAVRPMMLGNGKYVLDISDTPSTTQPAQEHKTAAAEPKTTPSAETRSAEAAAARVGTAPSEDDMLSIKKAHNQMVALLKQAAREGLITIRDDGQNTTAAAEKTADDSHNPTKKREHVAKAPSQQTLNEPEPHSSPVKTGANDDHKEHRTHDEPVTAVPVVHASIPAEAAASTGVKPKSAIKTALCQPDGIFEIDGTDFEEEPLVEISELQDQLGGDVVAGRMDVVQKLAAGFMSIGFGEEALALLIDSGAKDSLRTDLARIIAERTLSPSSPLASAQNCHGAHALWQAAASEDQHTPALFARSGNAVENLPHRLRAIIATRIAMKLINAEDYAGAEKLYEVALADAETPGPDLRFVRARLDQHSADPGASHQTLLDIASSNAEASDDALLALAEDYAHREKTPHAGFTEDIGALAKLGGSTRAMLAEADAWAKLGNVDAALFLLKSVGQKSDLDLKAARISATEIFDDAYIHGDETTRTSALDSFLKHKEWYAPDQLAIDTRIASAKLSQDVGLPNLALTLLDEIETRDDTEYLMAKATAALDAGEMQDAIQIAAPHSADPNFGEIIVDANIRNGNYDAALAAAASINDKPQNAAWASKAAWLARSWKSAANSFRAIDPNFLNENSALKFALTAYKANETTLPSSVDAVLAQSNNTLTEGLKSVFSESPEGSTLQRGRIQVEQSNREIQMIQEILNDG